MADQSDKIALLTYELLQRVHVRLDGIAADIHDLKVRMSAMEVSIGNIQLQIGQMNARMDRFDDRLTRIETRLDLIAAE
jgi:predicted  nucleic acid-binding Zn-ribbon protein